MSKNPSYKRSRSDDIILDFLRGNPCSRKELIAINKRKDSPISKIPYKTLDRRLKQLEKYGYIEHIPDVYKIVERIEEADPEEVQQCIQVIREQKKEKVIFGRIDQLRQISAGKRVAHLPGVVSCLTALLEKLEITHNSRMFGEILLILEQILNFEQQNKSPDSERILEKLVDNTLNKVISIINRTPEFPDNAAIRYLGRTGRKEAVHILFRKIKNNPSQAKKQINDLTFALGKHNLYKRHKKLISEYLDTLLQTDDHPLSEFAIELGHQIRWTW